jgi:hypothetical protein
LVALQALASVIGSHVPPTQTSPAGQMPLGWVAEQPFGGNGPLQVPCTQSCQDGQVPPGFCAEHVTAAVTHEPA